MKLPTIADSLLFDALPLETREAVKRLYGGEPPSDEWMSEELDKARVLGFKDGYRCGYAEAREELGKEKSASPPSPMTP